MLIICLCNVLQRACCEDAFAHCYVRAPPGNHFPYSGPFFICFSSMLISTASNVVKSARKMKNVSATDIVDTLLMAAFVGSMS